MKIIILGAGQVGRTLAETLASEDNDITVVDQNGEHLKELQDRLDIRTILGSASHPNILADAGAEDTDMLVAVTNSDEVNMVACQVAHALFHTPTIISRIKEHQYQIQHKQLFHRKAFPIDVIISPEKLVTSHVQRLIENPSALQVLDFADGRVRLVAVRAHYDGPLVNQPIAQLRRHMPKVNTRVAAIFRKDRAVVPSGDTIIHVDDEVFFVAAKEDIRAVMSELRRLDKPYKRVMIAGGGNIGARLAHNIEHNYRVKLIEHGLSRCKQLAEMLDNTIVLHGSASDQELLIEENIESTDVFCALTNADEANIMASILAKRLGVRTVMTLISNPAYMDLIEDGSIDIAISPQQTTISSLLTHVRRGDIVNVHSLRRGAAEAIEVVAHGDIKTSQVVGRRLDAIDLPDGTSFGALVRGENVLMAHHDLVIENNDHVILFLADRHRISDVEQLFTVDLNFF
jgi:trk system potassium uptake protein